jgi:hypothetical protein
MRKWPTVPSRHAGSNPVISADDVGRQYGGIIGPVRLLVRLDEAELARQILRLPSN